MKILKAEYIRDNNIILNINVITKHQICQAVHCNTLTYEKHLEIPKNYGYILQAFQGEYSCRGRPPGKQIFVNLKLLEQK